MSTPTLRSAYAKLRELNPSWLVELAPPEGERWIAGTALLEPERGAYADVLRVIGEGLQTTDRKVIAASFALRYGWSSAAAIAPWLVAGVVPDVALENVSLRFRDNALFERVALHEVRTRDAPLHTVLVESGSQVIDGLHRWSRLSRHALWGQVASSWAAQFEPVLSALGRADEALALARAFFAGSGPACAARPQLYSLEHLGLTRVYHRRATCCLYYKTPTGSYCASCPLISDAERIARNRQWTERFLPPT